MHSRWNAVQVHRIAIAAILALTCAIVVLGLFLAGQKSRARNYAARQLLQKGAKLIAPEDIGKQSVFAKLIFGDNKYEFIEIIHLDSVTMTEQELSYLGRFPRLETVLLRKCPTAQAALDELSTVPTIRRLHFQDVPTLDLDSIGHMPNLEECVFEGVTWSPGSLKSLCTIPNLKSVSLTGVEIDQHAVLVLAKCHQLRELNLADCDIAKDAWIVLSQIQSLESFSAPRSNFSVSGLESLASLAKLVYIDLRDTKIDDEDLSCLHPCHSLRYALLQGTQVTSQGISEFKRALPECNVGSDF